MPDSFPNLYTSFWSNRVLDDVDAVKVSISRGQPRYKLGFKYRMAPELAPSKATFAIQDEREFSRAYRRQLDDLGIDVVLGKLSTISERDGGRSLILLCYERPDDFCHRHVLRDWLRWENIPIRELAPGDLPRRRDVPQPSLFEQGR